MKEYLSRCSHLRAEIRCVQAEIEELRCFGVMSRSVTTANSRRGHNESAVERVIEKLDRTEKELIERLEEYMTETRQIRILINQLRGRSERILLENHYIRGLSWEQAAEEADISIRTAYNMRRRALKELEKCYELLVR